MSDYPFKVGDLVQIKPSAPQHDRRSGVIVSINSTTGKFDVLIEGVIHSVHVNYVVVPKVQNVKLTGGLK